MLLVSFLGCQEVTARSFAFSFCRTSVSRNVTEAFLDREIVEFGSTFVSSSSFIVAIQLAAVRLQVTLMRKLSVLSGTLHVFLRDGLPRGKFLLPAPELLGTLGGFVTW